MGDVKLLNDPKHWRGRAEEARMHAERIHDPEARRMMLVIAASYDRIAERAEERGDPKAERNPGALAPRQPQRRAHDRERRLILYRDTM
jgi:hypothetical protein